MYFTKKLIENIPDEILELIFLNINLKDVLKTCNYYAIKYLFSKRDFNYTTTEQIECLHEVVTSKCKYNDKIRILDYLVHDQKFTVETETKSILDGMLIDITLFNLFKYMVKNYKIDINNKKNSLLHNICSLLIETDLFYKTNSKLDNSIFIYAKYIINLGCDINIKNSDGENVLFRLLHDYLSYIRSSYYNINYDTNEHYRKTIINIVEYFISKGININEPNNYNEYLFIECCKLNSIELCNLFIKNKADINVYDKYGNRGYMYINDSFRSDLNNKEYVKFICSKYNYFIPNNVDDTILHVLSKNDQYNSILDDIIKTKKCDIVIKNIESDTCFNLALKYRSYLCFNVILNYMKDDLNHRLWNSRNKYGYTIFIQSIIMNDIYFIKKLINKVTIKQTTPRFMNALHLSMHNNTSLKLVKLLIEYGINKNDIDANQQTPLDLCYRYKIKEYLISVGCKTFNNHN